MQIKGISSMFYYRTERRSIANNVHFVGRKIKSRERNDFFSRFKICIIVKVILRANELNGCKIVVVEIISGHRVSQ